MKSHLLPLFQPETSVAFVVCGPGHTEDVVAGFLREGFEVDMRVMDDSMPWDIEGKGMAAATLEKLKGLSLGGHSIFQGKSKSRRI